MMRIKTTRKINPVYWITIALGITGLEGNTYKDQVFKGAVKPSLIKCFSHPKVPNILFLSNMNE
jgi:hypothetical protein